MTDVITTPFGRDNEELRKPTTGERESGFVAGAADPGMMSELHRYHDAWFIRAGADASPEVPIDTDNEEVLKNLINTYIAMAGSGGTNLANNPVYPEVTDPSGLLGFTINPGEIIVNASQTFSHRGGVLINTDDYTAPQRTFATEANKTYHLRWAWNGGSPAFSLNDLQSAGYNPTSVAEGNVAFDSKYDDAFFARVVTDGSNVLTVTPLINKNKLAFDEYKQTPDADTGVVTISDSPGPGGSNRGVQFHADFTFNMSRTPKVNASGIAGQGSSGAILVNGYANWSYIWARGGSSDPVDRYGARVYITTDFNDSLVGQTIYGGARILAVCD